MQRLPPRLRTWLRAGFWFAVELAVEVSLTVVFLKAYNGTRNLFGSSQEGSLQVALRNALDIVAVERALGVYWEEAVQEASLTLGPAWIRAWNIFYCSAHMAVTIFVLLFLFTVQPAAYQRCRWTFMLMNIIAMAGYAGYPLMPPRLLPACDGAYGGCLQVRRSATEAEVEGAAVAWHLCGIFRGGRFAWRFICPCFIVLTSTLRTHGGLPVDHGIRGVKRCLWRVLLASRLRTPRGANASRLNMTG
eukprot:364111-Chlamydomonas_euryale.AAC.7